MNERKLKLFAGSFLTILIVLLFLGPSLCAVRAQTDEFRTNFRRSPICESRDTDTRTLDFSPEEPPSKSPFVQRLQSEFGLGELPGAHIPDRVEISVKGTVSEQLIRVQLNDESLAVYRLNGEGSTRTIEVDFQRIRNQNRLSVELVRPRKTKVSNGQKGSKSENRVSGRVSGKLYLERWEGSLPDFRHLRFYLGSCYELYFPVEWSNESRKKDEFAELLSGSFGVLHAPVRVHYGGDPASGRTAETSNRFVVVGDKGIFEDPHVARDRGRIRFIDFHGKPLFEIGDQEKYAIAQIVRQNEISGLWFSGDPALALHSMHPVIGQVAVWDSMGIRARYRPGNNSLINVSYPDHYGFTDHLHRKRWILFLLGVLAITFISFYLYREVKRHEPNF
jgi:hypothetical protein